jgi:hypothetical protein
MPALGRRAASCSSSVVRPGVGSRNVARSGKYGPTNIGCGKPIPGTVNGLELGEWWYDMIFLRPILIPVASSVPPDALRVLKTGLNRSELS